MMGLMSPFEASEPAIVQPTRQPGHPLVNQHIVQHEIQQPISGNATAYPERWAQGWHPNQYQPDSHAAKEDRKPVVALKVSFAGAVVSDVYRPQRPVHQIAMDGPSRYFHAHKSQQKIQ